MGDNNCVPIQGQPFCKSFYPEGTEPDEGALRCNETQVQTGGETIKGQVCLYPSSEGLPGPLRYVPEFVTAGFMRLFSADVDEDAVEAADAADPEHSALSTEPLAPVPRTGISAQFGIKVPVTE
ncbi:MAG: hypothetical protein JXA24_04455, partial [Proteobacteria bacterium]|nr:hypothetical protein [Pseudomonadota bacterium]